jgi:hypothetical protein
LIDWKTGKVREEPFELEVQAFLLKAHRPRLEIIKGRFFWLKEKRLGDVHDLSDTERTANSIRRQIGEIESRREREWPKTPNPLCGWCRVTSCEHNSKGKTF